MTLLWTQKQDVGPTGRIFPAMTFDASRERVVLFGGQVAGGVNTGDTWSWDGADWTQVSDMGPSARAGGAMAFDALRERVVLFGGTPITGAVDTWEWDGAEWTQVADSGPEARYTHAMTFDVVAQRVLVFGGLSGPPTSSELADTWAWDGAAWTEVAHFGPPAAMAASAECDGHTVLHFGGGIATSSPIVPFGGTWQWNGQHWTQRQDMGPQPRMAAGLAFDSTRNRYVLFGGAGAPPSGSTDFPRLSDTWETFDPATPSPVS